MLNIGSLIPKFISNLPVYGVVGLTVVTSGVASFKIMNNDGQVNAQKTGVAKIQVSAKSDDAQPTPTSVEGFTDDTDSSEGTQTNTVSQQMASSTTVAANNSTSIPGATFTLASLALHNKPGDCYVAYNGVVYNVSKHPSWSSCNHHGIAGGIDITSRFPHSTSYFSTLPKMGTLIGGQTGGGSGTGGSTEDSEDDGKSDDNESVETEHRVETTKKVEKNENDD